MTRPVHATIQESTILIRPGFPETDMRFSSLVRLIRSISCTLLLGWGGTTLAAPEEAVGVLEIGRLGAEKAPVVFAAVAAVYDKALRPGGNR